MVRRLASCLTLLSLLVLSWPATATTRTLTHQQLISPSSTAQLSNQQEIVAFNTKTLKFHCRTCSAAVRCTRNCINISKSDAIARGGVACKLCGGSCK